MLQKIIRGIGCVAVASMLWCGNVFAGSSYSGDVDRPHSGTSNWEYVGFFGHKKTSMIARVRADVAAKNNGKWKFDWDNIDEGFSHDYDQDTASAKFYERNDVNSQLGIRVRDDRTENSSCTDYDFASWHINVDTGENRFRVDANDGGEGATHYMAKIDPGKSFNSDADGSGFDDSIYPFYLSSNEGSGCGRTHEVYTMLGAKPVLMADINNCQSYWDNTKNDASWNYSSSQYSSVYWDDKAEKWSKYTLDGFPVEGQVFFGWIGKQDESWIRPYVAKCQYVNANKTKAHIKLHRLDFSGNYDGAYHYLTFEKGSDFNNTGNDSNGRPFTREDNKIGINLENFRFDGYNEETYNNDDWNSVVVTEVLPRNISSGRMKEPNGDTSKYMQYFFFTCNSSDKDTRIYGFFGGSNIIGIEIASISN